MKNKLLKKDYRQYENKYLCRKWNNNIPANELEFKTEMFVSDSQEIHSLCEYFSFLPEEDITAYVCNVGDGDYTEIYVTESSHPYSYDAVYHPLTYYL